MFLSTSDAVSQCAITNIVATSGECNENDEFTAEIDFDFDETGENGFQILGNVNYGTFQYEDLPISIPGLMGNCETAYEFIVRDIDDPACAASVELGVVCCGEDCEMTIIDFETTDCEDNLSYGVSFDLEYQFEGEDGFSVSINEEAYGSYSYEDLPLSIDEIVSVEEELNTITVCDNDFEECCDTYTFLNPCVCGMTNITSEIVDCNAEDSTYYTIINFDHVATNDSFQMGYSNNGTNIFLGTFAYADLPVVAGPIFLSENDQEILIVDTEDFFCFNSAFLGRVDDCDIECQLFNLFGEAYECEEGEYFIDLEFEAEDIEGSTFEVLVDGTNYGTFEYGENSYTVGPIPSDCENAPVLVIQDSAEESCSDFYNFSEPICCLPDCNFTSLEVTTECGPTTLQINGVFENNGIMLNAFYFVQILGTSYGPFPYADFTFSIEIPLLDNGEYEITINDSIDPECQITGIFEAQCDEEPCIIFDVFAEASECEENQFMVDVEFNFAGEVSDSFTIAGNGMNYGTFAYGEQFYTVGPLEGDCETIYEFVVNDQIFEGCNSFYAFEEPVCCESDCEISGIVISEIICSDSLTIASMDVFFQFENPNSEQFYITINEFEDPTLYNYADLPITIDYIIPNEFTILIQDSENPDCNFSSTFDVDCSDECSITNVEFEFIECNDEGTTYFGSLNFDFLNTNESFIVWKGSINQQDTFDYADLPVDIGPLLVGISQTLTIINMGSSCSAQEIVLIEDCETSVEDNQFSNIKILRSTNIITIENNESEDLSFRLFNTTGVQMKTLNLRASISGSMDTSQLPGGLYLFNMTDGISQKTVKIVVF